MELARIIDPRHDRDPDVVMAEIRSICDVLVRSVEEIVKAEKIVVDKHSSSSVHSVPATQEDLQDAATNDTQTAGDATARSSRKGKRSRSQVPLP